MPISIKCSGCGQKLKAKDSLAGRRVACPKCGEKLLIAQHEEDSTTYLLKDEPPAETPGPPAHEKPQRDEAARAAPTKRPGTKPLRSLPPLTMNEPPLWLRHLHWTLILALLPLAFSLLLRPSADETPEKRFFATINSATPEQQQRIEGIVKQLEAGKGSFDEVFAVFPEQRIVGAFLPRNTLVHWLFALASAAVFMGFFGLLSVQKNANPVHLICLGLFTATIGIGMLLLFQLAAEWSQGFWVTGRGILVILFYVVKLIGFSYRAAADPENGLLLSFFGYTLGVGLCEEVVKALPLIVAYRRGTNQTWRGAFLWGLASGAGFGIAEGIMYSSSFYNGIHGPAIYVVRFVSCVALHALWTGSVGITLNQRQELIQRPETWYEFIPPVFLIVAVPMVLHGLYDTLLKKDMSALALVVALLSFLFLAFQISRLRGVDDDQARREMLKEYQRRRKALA